MRSYSTLVGALVLVLLLTACGGGTPTPRPSNVPTSAQPSNVVVSAQPSAAPSPEPSFQPATPATHTTPATLTTTVPTEVVPSPSGAAASLIPLPSPTIACAGGGSTGTLTGALTLWNAYASDPNASQEQDALSQALAIVCAENPALQVSVLSLSYSDLLNAYQQQAPSGSPDLFIAGNDSMYRLAELNLLKNVADAIDATKFNKLSVDGSSYTTLAGEQGIWQVPESLKAVALYYNKDTVPTPPATTDDLMNAVVAGKHLGLVGGATGLYSNIGWWGGFGGKLMDDTGKCVADQGGVADALSYLQNLQAAGATFFKDYADMSAAFKSGNLDMIVDGPWAAANYLPIFKNLGVAPMPAGPSGPALPLTSIDGYGINPNSAQSDLAVSFALRMVQPDTEKIFADVAYHVPAAAPLPSGLNPISTQFAGALQQGFLNPRTSMFDAFWSNFGNAMLQVLDEGVDPATAVSDACAAMNHANGIE